MERPLLVVDIDGVLNAGDGECPSGFEEHWLFPDDDEPVRVCPSHGRWLHELGEHYDLAWGSAWTVEDRAQLATVLDLPSFVAAVDLPTGRFDPVLKMPAVDAVAGARSLAWVDDALTVEAERWAGARPSPTLLVPVDPLIGLERRHVDLLIEWASRSEPDGRTE